MSPLKSSFSALADRANMLRLAGALLTAIFYTAALPPHNRQECGWFALAPLLLLIRHSTPRQAAAWGGLAGLFFWVPALTWLWRLIGNGGPLALVVLGQVGLAAWCAAFFALYAWLAARLWQRIGSRGSAGRLLAVWLGEPLLWAGCELLRGYLFSGFPWDTLATSLATSPAFIQAAAIGGAPLISALLALGAGAIASIIERTAEPLAHLFPGAVPLAKTRYSLVQSLETFMPLLVIIAAWYWGVGRLRANPPQLAADDWLVVLVQPDSPSIFAISEEKVIAQRRVLAEQTRLAACLAPDLVVWPETAVNGWVPTDPEVMKLVAAAAADASAPLLTGAVEVSMQAGDNSSPPRYFYYNAAWLFASNGLPMGRYRKQHLVPFGEYIPGDKIIPVLQRLAPTGLSCTPGKESTILRITRKDDSEASLPFSPLICFEDLFSALSRRAVRRGAALLVNISNDAWFEGSNEPERHMRQALFRAVENGVPLLRCGNTGVTCAIDPYGRLARLDAGAEGARGLIGFLPARVSPAARRATFYTSHGDLPLVAAVLIVALPAIWPRRGGK